MIRGVRLNIFRVFRRTSPKQSECFSSSISVVNVGVKDSGGIDQAGKLTESEGNTSGSTINNQNTDKTGLSKGSSRSTIVSAAFESLKGLNENESNIKNNQSLDDLINKAQTVDSLLSITDKKLISKVHAYKVFSILSAWTVSKKVNAEDLEKDARFVRLCEFLNKSVRKHLVAARKESVENDLSIVSDVSNEDEAAKLSSTLSMQQLVKVLHSLALKQKRSLTLLRSLSFNITENSEELNIKLCADVLYSLACLNFPDEMLLARVTADLCKCIPVNEKPAVIRSILTSLGILRYRDTELLEILYEWVLKNFSTCRIQDLVALILTAASVQYPPVDEGIIERILPSLNISEGINLGSWLDVVWSLVIINKVTENHLSSVLSQDFIDKLTMAQNGMPVVYKIKLLQVNAFAKLAIKDYSGSLLDSNNDQLKLTLQRTKEKQNYVNGTFDTLTNLFPSSIYLQKDVDLGLGFLIDGICRMDEKMTPIALVDKKTNAPINENKGSKIAIMAYDFHDFCRGSHNQLNGPNSLCRTLTELSGFKILSVPYNEFILSDKLTSRVQYLENKLKSIVKQK